MRLDAEANMLQVTRAALCCCTRHPICWRAHFALNSARFYVGLVGKQQSRRHWPHEYKLWAEPTAADCIMFRLKLFSGPRTVQARLAWRVAPGVPGECRTFPQNTPGAQRIRLRPSSRLVGHLGVGGLYTDCGSNKPSISRPGCRRAVYGGLWRCQYNSCDPQP